MKNVVKVSLVCLLWVGFQSAQSQSTKEFPKDINSIKMTAPGVAVVGTDDALYGIDKDGKELWKNDKLRKIDATRIEILEGSELILVQGGLKGGGTRVLNVLTGADYGVGGPIYGARIIHGTNHTF